MANDNRIELYLRLTPEQAMARLVGATDSDTPLSLFTSNPFLLRHRRNWFQVRKRIFFGNVPFHPVFSGRLEPEGQGTRLSGYLGLARDVKIFLAFWFGFVGILALVWCTTLSVQYFQGTIDKKQALWIFHPIAMLLFGWLMLQISKFITRKHIPEITAFLHHLFESAVTDKERLT